MRITLNDSDKSLNAIADINHHTELLTIRQKKENVVLTFDQFKKLYESVNAINQISKANI